MRYVPIKTALQYVADHPRMEGDDVLGAPVHELVCRTLFDIANNPMSGKRGAQAKANAARTLIFDRMVGKRMAGSHPATRKETTVKFGNLTGEVGK